jgi:hypothetical protein
MTAPQAGNPVTAFAATIGRYFTIVSVVPSLLLVAYLVVLARSHAWSGTPDMSAGIRSLAQLGLGGTFALILASLALGLVLHPLQVALTQFLEGYWGVSRFWAGLRGNRIRHHVRRRQALRNQAYKESEIVRKHYEVVDDHRNGGPLGPEHLENPALATRQSAHVAAQRLQDLYPTDVRDVMPTRLGNVLRAAEKRAGGSLKLDVIAFAPHLMMVAPRPHAEYVNDQRTALDLALRTCLVCILGFAASLLYLWSHGLWLLVTLIPLGLAWLCYLGAVTTAREYGAALRLLVDLNRFAMYEQMRLPMPQTTDAERRIIALAHTLSNNPGSRESTTYRHPPPTTSE